MKYLPLIILALFAIWWFDPSTTAERSARSARAVAAENRAIESDATWDRWMTPVVVGCALALVFSGTVAGIACMLLGVESMRRRVTTWRPDARGLVALSDRQRDEGGLRLVEGHQDVQRIEAGTVRPQLTQIYEGHHGRTPATQSAHIFFKETTPNA